MSPEETSKRIERLISRIHTEIFGEVVDRTPSLNNENWDIISRVCTEESVDPCSIARIMGYRLYDIDTLLDQRNRRNSSSIVL